ncbi:sensor histidine kinase [Novosphingopyxis sp.]|uniref:sensor histidine kinase n=1 Tax=Novosphingopyxis sp. TaxID=2709690 RepID=UPI003B59EDCE
MLAAIDDDALDCGVPPLLLQPLVENAVRHGIDQCPNGGTVRVAATIERDRLSLVVADDGVGCAHLTNEFGSGVGIAATRRQIDALFNSDARVEITTAAGTGFRIALELPALLPGQAL